MIQWDKNDVYKEIEQIQSCITRMANNSFYIKGWHIGLLSALVAFFVSRKEINYIALFSLTFIITIIFGYLDSYYLLLERKYRWKYQWVISNRIKDNKITIDTTNYLNLNPNEESMWEESSNDPGIIAAKESIKNKNETISVKLKCHFYELGIVMKSVVIVVEYATVSVISLFGLIINLVL